MNKQMLKKIVLIGLFLIPFTPFLVSTSLLFPYITTKAFAFRFIVEIIFAAWAVLALMDSAYRPKKSPILYSLLGFLVVIGLADLFGMAPLQSFWSNFERMEGYISLLHLGALFMVMSSVLDEVNWKRWWNTTVVASALMVGYTLFQILGAIAPSQAAARVDGTFGNAIYLAVYMLFHIFVTLLLLYRERTNATLKWLYGILIVFQVIILYYTATRGAILGLLGGIVIMALLNMRNREAVGVRKVSVAAIVGLVVLVGGFYSIRNSEFVTNSPVLSRFSSLNAAELKTQGRYFIWPIALKGFSEHPIFGWGQENFMFVFQKYYKPEMHHLEPWFDRAHNIFLDWLVAGGALGLAAYLSLYLAMLYLIWKKDNSSYTEKTILTGLIAAYFFHNFFVFDHLISYVLFFSLLAYIHSRNGASFVWNTKDSQVMVNVISPIILILLIGVMYVVNVKPLSSNTALINGLKELQVGGTISKAIANFQKAYPGSPLGRTEVVEHVSNNTPAILSSNISTEDKNSFYNFVHSIVVEEADSHADNARTQMFAGSLLSSVGYLTGSFDEALKYLNAAKELSPNKQHPYFEIGSVYISQGKPQEAFQVFKKAYDLAPDYKEAKIIYLIGSVYASNRAVEQDLLTKLTENEIVFDQRILSAYYVNKRYAETLVILNRRLEVDPDNAETYSEYIKQVEKESAS